MRFCSQCLQPLRGKGPAGIALCFHLSVLEQGHSSSPGVRPFALCTDVYVLVALRRPPWSKSWSREQLLQKQTSLLPLPQHPMFLSQLPPLAASPSPCWARAKCPCCHRAHILAVVPLTPGAVPPCAPQQSPFCWGQSRAGGAWLGHFPPNTNQEGEHGS